MKLLEYEGKMLLARHGLQIPAGTLWPAMPEDPVADGGWVVKAQVLAGGRGKRGGIQIAADRDEVALHAKRLHGGRLGDEPIHAVYVEQRLAIDHEYYLAAFVDRDAGRVSVMASDAGGVDIEAVPASRIVRFVVDPLIGLAGFQLRALRHGLAIADPASADFDACVRAVVDTLQKEDAELVEVNPLVRTVDGRWIAADAKVVLDDDAVDRHPARAAPVAWSTDSRFMQRCRELGAIGVDNRVRTPPPARPSVAVLSNGAGLTMATYDQMVLSGLGVAGAIELHGALARGVEHTADVIETLFLLEADLCFINAFYQLRSTEALAQALVIALARPAAPPREHVVVRMRGYGQQTSQRIVEDAGCFHTESLATATERVLELANVMSAGRKAGR